MDVPVFYDLMWILVPLALFALTSIVFFNEKRSGSSNQRAALWAAMQFILPILGFVAWIAFRTYERHSAVEESRSLTPPRSKASQPS